jgi:uncharacterized repeat protein (TIGR01451 family)
MRRHEVIAHRADWRDRRCRRRPYVEALEERSLLATITVTGTGDTIANDGVVTLREAIVATNTNTPSGDAPAGEPGPIRDDIRFNIPGEGVRTIDLTSALPTITDPVTIDGYSQPGARPNSLADGEDAILLIELSRGNQTVNGLTITAGNSLVRGLVINRNISTITSAIEIRTKGGNRIEGNFLGSDATGTTDVGTQGLGVDIIDANDNTIGGTTPAARNLISGIGAPFGIRITSLGIGGEVAARNLVQGNFIGTNAAGTARLSGGAAVFINNGPSNTIGGTAAGARNVIGYSPSDLGQSSAAAVVIRTFQATDAGATGNLVQGNFIGIDVTGTTALTAGPSSSNPEGVELSDAAGNTIGGTTPGAGNVISGNKGRGILIVGNRAANNLVQGNFIGTDASGMAAVPNSPGFLPSSAGAGGVLISDAAGNTIGGTTPGARNIISGNGANGINLSHSPGPNVIEGNFIGINAAGGALGNTGHGVLLSVVSGVDGNTIGGTAAGAGNVIAFNGLNGVTSPGSAGFPFNTGNAILSNTIFANGGVGIDLALDFDGDGPTANDTDDADAGPNNFQNFPVVTTAASAGASTTITGTLDSAPGIYRLEFFASDAADPSRFGEGQIFLGFSDVTIDAGTKDFNATLPVAVGPTQFVTATATDAAGNTSEFSQLIATTSAGHADLAVRMTGAPDTVSAGDEITYTVTVTNNGPDPATDVKLTDTLDPGATFVSATGGVTPVGRVLSFGLGTLADGGSFKVVIVVVPETAGRQINTAEATSNESDAVVTNNADSLATEVSRIATTTVTPSESTAIRNGVATFVVSVAHRPGTGAGPTGSVTLRDGRTELGSARLDASGTATFTIADLAPGSHAIIASYAGDDRYAPSEAAAMTVRIDPAPSGSTLAIPGGPIAVSDEYRMLARTKLTVSTSHGVLWNDRGTDGRPTEARLVQGPGHGRLVFRADGTFRYVPRANFRGTDSFTYVASDRQENSAPTVVRIRVESLRLERRTAVVPGEPQYPISLRFTWTVRDARFNNELGVIRVDDADGSIGGIRTGDRRYLRAAVSAGRMKVVFRSGESAGISREISLRGGERFLVYLVQDQSTAMVLKRNAEDRPGRSPRVFFADPAANPDRFEHVRASDRAGGLSLAWEDLLRGGDRDFNDMVLTIRAIRLGRSRI